MCATLVALRFFKEIQLSFIIVRHTHKDIDQYCSSMSLILKQQYIKSLEELFQVICKRPTHREQFVHAKHLEHKEFEKKLLLCIKNKSIYLY